MLNLVQVVFQRCQVGVGIVAMVISTILVTTRTSGPLQSPMVIMPGIGYCTTLIQMSTVTITVIKAVILYVVSGINFFDYLSIHNSDINNIPEIQEIFKCHIEIFDFSFTLKYI